MYLFAHVACCIRVYMNIFGQPKRLKRIERGRKKNKKRGTSEHERPRKNEKTLRIYMRIYLYIFYMYVYVCVYRYIQLLGEKSNGKSESREAASQCSLHAVCACIRYPNTNILFLLFSTSLDTLSCRTQPLLFLPISTYSFIL